MSEYRKWLLSLIPAFLFFLLRGLDVPDPIANVVGFLALLVWSLLLFDFSRGVVFARDGVIRGEERGRAVLLRLLLVAALDWVIVVMFLFVIKPLYHQDPQEQIDYWLKRDQVKIISEQNFLYEVEHPDGYFIKVFLTKNPTPTLIFQGTWIWDRQVVDSLDKKTKQQMMNSIQAELTKLGLSYDSTSQADWAWELKITSGFPYDRRALTHEKFLEEMDKVDQGLKLASGIVQSYIGH